MLVSLLLACALGASLEVPPNDGWITDLAGFFQETHEAALESLMESYRAGTGHEVAVLTLPSLEGESLEAFALEVAREWGLGREGENDGILFLVARDERLMRIEVGRGLEGNVPDVIAGRIIRDVVAPYFRREDYSTGIERGVLAIHGAIGGDYGALERSSGGRDRAGRTLGSLIGLGFFGFVLLSVMAAAGRRGRYGGQAGTAGTGSIWPWIFMGALSGSHRTYGSSGSSSGGFGLGGGGGFGGFGGFGGGGGFSGGGASGGW